MDQPVVDRDKEILKLLRHGRQEGMDMLYADHAAYLTGVCARYIEDANLKDVMQESLIKIFTRIDQFEYRGTGSLRAWMSRIVVNESLQTLRDRRRTDFVEYDDHLPDLPDEDPDLPDEDPDRIVELVRQLPEGYRTVLNLFVFEGKTHREIAEMLNISPDTSASQFHRAKNMLAKLLKENKRKIV